MTEYVVAQAEISLAWSESVLKQGPQLGDGEYTRVFLCGRNAEEEWRIYKIYNVELQP